LRRIWLVVAAMAMGLLTGGATQALAAKTKAKPKSKAVKVSCKASVGTMPAAGDDSVIPPVQQGSQYGPIHCGKLLGSGIQAESFTLLDSGDLQGKYAQYFGAGTVHGTFALTPQDTGPPSSTTTFASVAYTGTVDARGGTGAFRKAAGKGKLACASTDGVHFSCTETVKIALPPVD
jgi:hypothetical protein